MCLIITTTTYVQAISFVTTTTVIYDSSGRPITVTITRAIEVPTPHVKACLSPEARASYEYLVTLSEKEPAKAIGALVQRMLEQGSLQRKRTETQPRQTARNPGLKPTVLLSE